MCHTAHPSTPRNVIPLAVSAIARQEIVRVLAGRAAGRASIFSKIISSPWWA